MFTPLIFLIIICLGLDIIIPFGLSLNVLDTIGIVKMYAVILIKQNNIGTKQNIKKKSLFEGRSKNWFLCSIFGKSIIVIRFSKR